MAAARNIPPLEDDVPAQQITITSAGVISPATYTIANQQPVTFTNNTANTITVSFEADPQGVTVFNPITVPGNGGTGSGSPLVNDRTVNFNIDGSGVYPYAIQVGAGPLYISVYCVSGVVYCNPSPAVIPAGGTLELYKGSGDSNRYDVGWPNVSAPPIPISSVDNAPHAATGTGSYSYTVKVHAGPIASIGQGGGTIKIGG